MEQMKKLLRVAKGKCKADLVVKNAEVFHGFTGEFIRGDVAICGGLIAGIGAYAGDIEIDARGRYVTPGFIDGHVHLESSMLSPGEFAKVVVPRGTTTIIADPHEIANVAGLDGIDYLLTATENLPLSVYMMLPSCVPASSLEDAGAVLTADDLAKFIDHPRVVGLGEVMNFPGVLAGDTDVLRKINLTGTKRVDGHAPGLSGYSLSAYAAAGVRSDHECMTVDDALARLRAGMYVMVREGSAAKNLLSLLPVINAYTAQFCFFVTDDRHPADLLNDGQINSLVRLAVSEGLPVELALQMATINAARYFGLRDRGVVAPGYRADLLIFDDLSYWRPSMVIQDGSIVAAQEKALFTVQDLPCGIIEQTMHIKDFLPESLRLTASGNRANVIGLLPRQIFTEALQLQVTVQSGEIISDPAKDILKLVVFERHHASGRVGVGLVHGFGLVKGAIASTVAHDSHNLIAIGTSDEDIIFAAKELQKMQGGVIVVHGGKILGALSLPIGGLMSKSGAAGVAAQVAELKQIAYSLGVKPCHDPLLTLAFLSLPVIPELKLTDRGLVDSRTFDFVSVAVE